MDVPHFVENKNERRPLSIGTTEKRCQCSCYMKMFLWPWAGPVSLDRGDNVVKFAEPGGFNIKKSGVSNEFGDGSPN